MLDHHSPDDDLMRALCQGHANALAVLAERWGPRLQRFGSRFLGDAHLAEDLAQEVLWRVYRARHRYRPQGRFAAWVYRVATRVAQNLRNGAARASSLEPEVVEGILAVDPGVDDRLQKRERAALVDWALAQLPEAQRLVIILRHYEGIKFDEIGRIVSAPPSTVKSRFQAGLQRLYAILKNAGYFPLEE